MDCKNCTELAKELAETQVKLIRAEKKIKQLERLIAAVGDYCDATAGSAAKTMRAGNIGRAEYGFSHSQFDFGNVILNILGLPPVKLKKKGVLGFGQGLFSGLFGG